MNYYNYTGVKKAVAEKSAQIVEKYRKQYQANLELYNYTKKGKQQMISNLINEMDTELSSLKNKFMDEAKEGVYKNKETLLLERQAPNKTEAAKTNELLDFFKQVNLYKAHIELYGADIQLLQKLAEDDNINEELFLMVKAEMVKAVDDDNATNLRLMKKKDLKMQKIEEDILDFKMLQASRNPILPVALFDKGSYELITGESLSNYYFSGDNEEVKE